jgi:glutamate--cysteine ligase
MAHDIGLSGAGAAGRTPSQVTTADRACDLTDVLRFARQTVGGAGPARIGPPTVGIETEWFVVDLAAPLRAVPPTRTSAALAELPATASTSDGTSDGTFGGTSDDPVLPGGSKITFEPGGQLELSGPPLPLAAAVTATEADLTLVRGALAEAGLALAAMGTDPLRPPTRTLSAARYAAMEHFFTDAGFRTGPVMMCSTASVQVNLDGGTGQADAVARWQRSHDLGPVLTAMFAASPSLAGRRTGWASTRQAIWSELDHSRSRPIKLLDDEPVDREGLCRAWASYLLAARVMLIRDGDGGFRPGLGAVTFGDWIAGRTDFGRLPTLSDLSYHATTVFPPVRPRGWLELRYLDAQPFGLWPVAVAVTAALLDDQVAAEAASEICRPAAERWNAAAMLGLRDPILHQAAQGIVPLAREGAARLGAGPDLLAAIDSFAETYVAAGLCPADALAKRLAEIGPTGLLRQEASRCIPSLS